jgi:hypothetical protein
MNTDQNFLGVFNTAWALVGHVELTIGGMELFEHSLIDVPEVVGLAVINLSHPGATLEKLQEQLKRSGIRSYILDGRLLESLLAVSVEEFPVAVRAQIVPEVLGLDPDHALAALEAVLDSHRS